MKNIKYIRIHWLLSCVAAIVILVSACKKDMESKPEITEVKKYAASPNDTVVQTINPGQWVVLIGHHLSGVTKVYFGSISATINTTLFTDESIVVKIPTIPFQTVSASKLNEITVISEAGIATFKIDITGEPIITRVRAYDTSSKNEIVSSIVPGQKINLIGYNLKNATKIEFQGVSTDLTKVAYTDTSAVVLVPTDLSASDASRVNTITYTTKIGTGSFGIKIIGPPVISRISNEIPKEGNRVYIYGNNFISVTNLSFAGTSISSYEVLADTVIGFNAPTLSADGGPVVVETHSGIFTTAYMVNDINFINGGGLGIIANLEWGDYFGYAWWGGGILNSSDPNSGWPSYNADFGVGLGMYIELKSNVLNGGEGDDGNAIRINDAAWVPAANLSDQGNNWALKFEINVAKPWKGGTICIKSKNGDYMARYEPWQISSSKTISYTTNGWQTVTIPLSAFRAKDATFGEGKGSSITKVSDLLDAGSGKGNLTLYLHNYSTAATATSFDAAFDNFRVVKR